MNNNILNQKEASLNECYRCQGKGKVICNKCKGDKNIGIIPCKYCNGSGKKLEIKCNYCCGFGQIRQACLTCDNGYISCYQCYGKGSINGKNLNYFNYTK